MPEILKVFECWCIVRRVILAVVGALLVANGAMAESQIRTFEQSIGRDEEFGILYGGFHYVRNPIYDSSKLLASVSVAMQQSFQEKIGTTSEQVTKQLDLDAEFHLLMVSGIESMEQRRYQVAEEFLQRAKEMRPHERDLLLTLSQLYFDTKKYAKAAAICDELSRGPDGNLYLNNMGVALGRMGEWKMAADAFHKVIAQYPPDAIIDRHAYFALYNLAWVHLNTGQYRAARVLYPRLLKSSRELAMHLETRLRAQRAW